MKIVCGEFKISEMETIKYEVRNGVFWVTLNRPEIHNAFNDQMIGELRQALKIAREQSPRVLVLTGEGKSFSAGADLNWMKRMKDFSYEENYRDSLELGHLLYEIYTFPAPTIALVNGHAFGGGVGLIAATDFAISVKNAKFGLTEVTLGLVPAVISPYLLKRMGERNLKELCLTGRRITAEEALKYGLLNEISDDIYRRGEELIRELKKASPNAQKVCKELVRNIYEMPLDGALRYTSEVIAKIRVSEEGQEGMNAFFEKRRPGWQE